jgi:hypothetical protein
MNLNYKFVNNKFEFYFDDNLGNKHPVSSWNELQFEFLSQLAILRELQDNGSAEYTEYTCVVNSLNILKLNDIDKIILDLPSPYPFEIYVESDGILSHNNFKFNYGFYDFCPNGTKIFTKRNGPILSIEDNKYLLSSNQYLLCEAIDEFNDLLETEKVSRTKEELSIYTKEDLLFFSKWFFVRKRFFISEGFLFTKRWSIAKWLFISK